LLRADYFLGPKNTYRYQTSGGYSGKLFDYTFSAKTPPSLHDGYPYWTAMLQERYDSITTRINTLTFAYLVTGQKKYLDGARDRSLNLAKWTTWSDPGYKCYPGPSCLDTGHAAMSIGYFYDAARTSLTTKQRTELRNALIKLGLIPLEKAADYILKKSAVPHNLDAIAAMGLGVAAAAIHNEDNRAPGWLKKAIQVMQKFLVKQGKDGGPLEYHGYGAYAMDFLVRLLVVARFRGHKIQSPFLQNMSTFYSASLEPSGKGMGTFGDSWTMAGTPTMFYLVSQGDAVAQGFLMKTGQIEQQDFLSIGWARGQLQPKYMPARVWAAPSVGYGVLRADPKQASTFAVFKSGPFTESVGHNQRDHLSFQLWAYGHWLTGDPGYSKRTKNPVFDDYQEYAHGHSALLVDGEGPQQKNGARLTGVYGGTGFGLLCGESKDSFRKGLVQSVQRCLAMHPDGFVTVHDRIQTPKASHLTWLFQPMFQGFPQLGNKEASLFHASARVHIQWLGTPVKPQLLHLAQKAGWPKTIALRTTLPGKSTGLKNPGFEASTFQGWLPRSTTRSAHTLSKEAFEGKQSASISFASSNAGYFYSDRITVKAGESLYTQAHIRTQSVSSHGARIRILFWKKGKYLSDAYTSRIKGTTSWHPVPFSTVVPKDADQATVALELSGKGTVWFDAVSWHKETRPQATDARMVTLLFPTRTKSIVNGGFERGFASWLPRSITIAAHTIDTKVFRTKSPSAKIHFTGKSNSGYLYGPHIAVKSGERLRAKAWIRTVLTSGRACLRFLFFHQNKYVSTHSRECITQTTNWQEKTLTFQVPKGASTVRMSLEFSGVGSVWFDDVSFENMTRPIDPKTLATPGSFQGTPISSHFTYAQTNFLILNAEGKPLQTKTPYGTASLDGSLAIYPMALKRPAIFIQVQKFQSPDGFTLSMDQKADLRIEYRGSTLWMELNSQKQAKKPTQLQIVLKHKQPLQNAELNGNPASVFALGQGQYRVCWGTFSNGPCAQTTKEPTPELTPEPTPETLKEPVHEQQIERIIPEPSTPDEAKVEKDIPPETKEEQFKQEELPNPFEQQEEQVSNDGGTSERTEPLKEESADLDSPEKPVTDNALETSSGCGCQTQQGPLEPLILLFLYSLLLFFRKTQRKDQHSRTG